MPNYEFFIAKKIISGGNSSDGKQRGGTGTIIRIAILGIALSIIVMLLATSIVTGFQTEIRSKAFGFGAHVLITSQRSGNNSYESYPISVHQPFSNKLEKQGGVRHVQSFAQKAGIIQTKTEIEGIMVKGINTDFDWSFFSKHVIEGDTFTVTTTEKSNKILISKHIATRLQLKVDDKMVIVFIVDDKQRKRVFKICGIYETGLEKFDEKIVLADIKKIQDLNGWSYDQVSGFEVYLDQEDYIAQQDEWFFNVNTESEEKFAFSEWSLNFYKRFIQSENDFFTTMSNEIRNNYGLTGGLAVNSILVTHQDIFGWLELQDMNVYIIIALMILVAAINMSSALLILILEKTNLIGLLKSLGSVNWSIRKIFLYHAAYLIGLGLLFGNIIGLGLAYLQKNYGLISLPEESYYISTVPINLDLMTVLFLNIGTLIICTLMLIIPTFLVTKISPIRALRFN